MNAMCHSIERHAGQLRAVLLIGACAVSIAHAAAPDPNAAEQARLTVQRAAAEQRYRDKEHECRQRFVVASCLEEVVRERRAALAPLRQRKMELDAARREQTADERRAELARKAEEDAARQREAAARQARKADAPREPRALEPKGGKVRGQGGAPASAHDKPSRSDVAKPAARAVVDENANRAKFDSRQAKALQLRADVAARNAAREGKRKVAAPLPVPPAAGSAVRP